MSTGVPPPPPPPPQQQPKQEHPPKQSQQQQPPPAHSHKHYELYRYTTIGATLEETVSDMIKNHQLPASVHETILEIFDKVVSDTMFPNVRNRVSFHGHLNSYRFCENVWTLLFDNFELREGQTIHRSRQMKVVACDGRTIRPRIRKRNKKSKKRKRGEE